MKTEHALDEHWALTFDGSGHNISYTLHLRADLSWIRTQYHRFIKKTTVENLYESLRSWLGTEPGQFAPDGMERIDLETSRAVERWVPRCYWPYCDGGLEIDRATASLRIAAVRRF